MTAIDKDEPGRNLLPAIIKDEEIDLVALMLQIWRGRWTVIKTTAVFLLLGLMLALFGTVKYTSTVTLIPEAGRGLSLGNLGGLAAQFGLGNLGGPLEDGAIPTEFYPDIIYSVPFMKAMMEYEIEMPGSTTRVTLFQYLNQLRERSLVSRTKNLVKRGMGLFGVEFNEETVAVAPGTNLPGVVVITPDELAVIEMLHRKIGFSVERNPETINVMVTMPHPVLAASVANRVAELLSEFVIKFRTDKARQDLEFVQERHSEARARFEEAQDNLARFRDANHGRLTAMAQTEDQRLQREYDLTFTVFNTLSRQIEESRLKVQEETPVVRVIQPAVVPLEDSAPRRMAIMIIAGFLGGFAGIGVLFGKLMWGKAKAKVASYGSME